SAPTSSESFFRFAFLYSEVPLTWVAKVSADLPTVAGAPSGASAITAGFSSPGVNHPEPSRVDGVTMCSPHSGPAGAVPSDPVPSEPRRSADPGAAPTTGATNADPAVKATAADAATTTRPKVFMCFLSKSVLTDGQPLNV